MRRAAALGDLVVTVGERYHESKTMRSHIEHYLNPLHLYCHLTLLGFPRGGQSFAMEFCRLYEHLIYRPILHKQLKGIRTLAARVSPAEGRSEE